MTDRGSPPTDGSVACPFVAFEDERDERSNVPDHRHRCYAEPRPAPRALAHQEAYCLSPSFAACPIFQDWARREAARARPSTGTAGSAAAGGLAARAGAPGSIEPSDAGSSVDDAPDAANPYAEASGAQAAADPLSSGPAARRRSGKRAWASPPPWAAGASGAAAASGAASASGVGGLADDDAGGDGRDLDAARAAEQDVDTPPFLAARERGADASAAPPASGVATDTRAARGAPEAYPEGDEDYSDEPGERTERPGAFAALAGLGGLFRRDPRPRAGTPRPVRQADIDRGAPSWERPRRYEAYPTLKTRMRMPSMSPPLVALLALVVAAVALFTLPGIFLNSGSPGARSTPTPSAQSSGPASATPVPSPTPLTYTIAKGDTLARIASKFHITQAQLVAANPQIKDPNKIVLGDVLVIPRPSASAITDTSSPSPSP